MRRLLPVPEDPKADREVDVADAFSLPDGDHVRAVFVESVDGAATDGAGRSGGLSGDTDRALFVGLREMTDVVLVGGRTVRVEGYGGVGLSPQAQARRRELGLRPSPPIAILSQSASFDPGARAFIEAHDLPLVITTEKGAADSGHDLGGLAEVVTAGTDTLDLPAALRLLRDRGLRRVNFEGGPTTFARLLSAGLVDELCLTLSPMLIGGDPLRVVHGLPVTDPAIRVRLTDLFCDDENFLFARYALR